MLLAIARVFSFGLIAAAGEPAIPSGDEILARLENTNSKRHEVLLQYSATRHYTLNNLRFGKQASAAVFMTYQQGQGERCTVVTRSGSEKLSGIIDKIVMSEDSASLPPGNAHNKITAANYRVRFLGTEVTAGRSCYVLQLLPKVRTKYLIVGKAWVDTGNYAVVRVEGRFAASISMLVGAPYLTQEFGEVGGFWLPARVRSVTSTFLLGPSELEILYSDYRLSPPE
jgi:negative regulator of sigma E activity